MAQNSNYRTWTDTEKKLLWDFQQDPSIATLTWEVKANMFNSHVQKNWPMRPMRTAAAIYQAWKAIADAMNVSTPSASGQLPVSTVLEVHQSGRADPPQKQHDHQIPIGRSRPPVGQGGDTSSATYMNQMNFQEMEAYLDQEAIWDWLDNLELSS